MRHRRYSVIAALAAAGVLVSESSPAGVKCRHERKASELHFSVQATGESSR
jgi:hypothetical protein